VRSATYDNAEAIGRNRLRERVSILFGKVVQRFGRTPHPSVASYIEDGYVCSAFTQERVNRHLNTSFYNQHLYYIKNIVRNFNQSWMYLTALWVPVF
jgi:hypothetical protein